MKIKMLFFIVTLLYLSSCDDESSVIELDDSSLVLNGFLYEGAVIDSIRFSEVISFSQRDSLEPLDDLEVRVSYDEIEIPLNPIGNGYYQNLDHTVLSDKMYTIKTVYNGTLLTASTFIPSKKDIAIDQTVIFLEKIENTGGFPTGINLEPEIIDISWNNDEGDYYFIDINNTTPNPEYVNDLIVEVLNEIPETSFTSEPDIIDTYSINSRRELLTYGEYEIFVYRLNPEYAVLYQSNGTSTLSLQPPSTNIDGGLGIFTGVTRHRLTLSVRKG